ncbi:hypothetical protein Vadar_012865 [Vaccinium darrowii]|uniref:Uncharacterized protein n=1 Tax=Vaccinium darrowii TaxID=229202 RepID=A0ACB7XYK2_9ERIC|nr:hypothetical protein Vadar_012865 [Vaccinium darrowii]
MGCLTTTSSEWLRTHWTPTMDHYFIDLMLDHIHKGNRVGNTFNKQAWEDMLTVFTAKFGSPHDKDLLKSHYSTLWTQFNDVKNLLDQSGFSWDDKLQMVIADDYVWETFIKADGRYSRSSHDIDFDDDIQGLTNGEVKEDLIPTVSNCARMYWTLPMDRCLIDLLFDQVLKGNKIGHALMTHAWNEIIVSFKSKFGSHYEKEVLKSRYKYLRQQYNNVNILLDQSGFYWDETKEMVIAKERVWVSFAKEYPDAQLYKCKTIPSYRKLCVVYGEESLDGRPSWTAHEEDPTRRDIQSNATGDYSKKDWTPSMDRYLIDLLLKQVHKGHKINHMFLKQALIDIVALFRDRFGSEHGKRVFRRQYKRLKKLYTNTKNLLELGEFWWDESNQMVTGPNDEHPEGKSFRSKAMPNYNDLFLVYGDSNSEGSWNQLNPHGGFNSDGQEDDLSYSSGDKQSFAWTKPMDRYFIELMLGQVLEGNQVDNTFNNQAWVFMITSFSEKFGCPFNRCMLESRYQSLIRQHDDISTLLNQNGFEWDEIQQKLKTDDDVWEAYIEEHPDAIGCKDKILENYSDLRIIFGDGNSSHLCPEIDIDDNATDMDMDGIFGALQSLVRDIEVSKGGTSKCPKGEKDANPQQH